METINWPVTTGCENLGGGCESCPSLWEYREKGWDYTPKVHEDQLWLPYKTKKPTIFTVSLGSDLFAHDVPDEFIKRVFRAMSDNLRHSFEIVTKRSARLRLMGKLRHWSPNIAIGVTVESAEYKERIEDLKAVPARTRFISFMPLLGPVGELDLSGIHAAGVGPEKWGHHRECKGEWIKEIEDQINDQGVKLLDYYNIYNEQEVEPCQA